MNILNLLPSNKYNKYIYTLINVITKRYNSKVIYCKYNYYDLEKWFNNRYLNLNEYDENKFKYNCIDDRFNEVCCICKNNILNTNYIKTNCNHTFCVNCIKKYDKQCPLCKTKILLLEYYN